MNWALPQQAGTLLQEGITFMVHSSETSPIWMGSFQLPVENTISPRSKTRHYHSYPILLAFSGSLIKDFLEEDQTPVAETMKAETCRVQERQW